MWGEVVAMQGNICQGCGGVVEFSPQDTALKCTKCGSIYSIERRQTVGKHQLEANSQQGIQQWMAQNKAYKCSNCGAQIVMDRFDISSTCQYCKNSTLVPQSELPGLKPEKVIPFKIAKQEAKAGFSEKVVKRHFLPSKFKKNLPSTEIGATYISSFVFACDVQATYMVVVREEEHVRDKDGTMRTITRHRHFRGSISKRFDNLVVEASDKLEQNDIKKVFPFRFEECYDYDNDFIKGYNVGYYNKTVEQAESEAKADALSTIKWEIDRQYRNVVSIDVHPVYSNMQYNYVLLPMYFITFDYKDKQYVNLMNGQTGKFSGSLPRSAGKISAFVIFILLMILGIGALILYFV